MNATFGRALAHDSWLHRCDPSVKLAVLLTLALAMTAVVDPVTPLLLYGLAWPCALVAGRIPVMTLVRAHVPFVAFGFSLLIVNLVTRDGPVLMQIGPFDISAAGVGIGLGLAMRTLLIGLTTVTFVATTDGARLMTSLHQHAHLSGSFAYAVLAGYRLLEQLPETWDTIRAAQAMRDRTRRGKGPSSSPRALARAAFGLLVSSVRRAERMSIALETRALGSGPRTIAHPSPLTRRDAVLAVAVVGSVAGVLVVSWQLGTLRGLGELNVFG